MFVFWPHGPDSLQSFHQHAVGNRCMYLVAHWQLVSLLLCCRQSSGCPSVPYLTDPGDWSEFLLGCCWVTWHCVSVYSSKIRRPLPSMLNSCLAVSTPKGSTPPLPASSSSTGVFSALDNWDSYWLLHSCWSFCVPVIINTFAVGLIPYSTSTITGRFLSSVCQDVTSLHARSST